MKITVTTDIEADDAYCTMTCRHLRGARPAECTLWPHTLERCLGGGPLRCAECLEAREAQEVPEITGTCVATQDLMKQARAGAKFFRVGGKP